MEITANAWGTLVLALLAVQLFVHALLDRRQASHVHNHSSAVPEPFADRISLEQHRKAAAYSIAKVRFSFADNIYSAALFLLFTFAGGLQFMHTILQQYMPLPGIWFQLLFLFSLWAVYTVLHLPWDWIHTFKLEQRFGFNRMTAKMFFTDLAKNAFLAILLGVPILSLVLFFANHGDWQSWLALWLLLLAVQIFLTWAWPTFIAPLFNKFRPLDNDELQQRIEKLLARNGFKSNGIYVMDGSARSTHGNAYFTGFGAARRIVFFDTLMDSLDHDQIEAVLAHELGHFKCNHIRNRMIVMALFSLMLIALMAWLLQSSWFYNGLGVQEVQPHTGLALFMLVMPFLLTFIQPFFSATSRRHEYEADDFAAAQVPAIALQRALVKLYRDNANTLTPDSWYSGFHHSHPPPLARISHLQQLAS